MRRIACRGIRLPAVSFNFRKSTTMIHTCTLLTAVVVRPINKEGARNLLLRILHVWVMLAQVAKIVYLIISNVTETEKAAIFRLLFAGIVFI